MKALITILFGLFLAGCSRPPQSFSPPPNKAAEELDIREATFRYQFGDNASGQQQRTGAYYFSIAMGEKESDPDDAFMKRFADHKPQVKKGSESEYRIEKGLVDKQTGENGISFTTGGIKWVSDTEVEIPGGYYEGNLSSSGNTYYLKKENGKWKVIKNVMHYIS